MLAMLFECCTCRHHSDDTDDFKEVEGRLYCVDCYDNEEIVMKCAECKYRSGNYDYFKLVDVSGYCDKTICLDCLDKCPSCEGRGCNHCYMTRF